MTSKRERDCGGCQGGRGQEVGGGRMREESLLKFALFKIVTVTSKALYAKAKNCSEISGRPSYSSIHSF